MNLPETESLDQVITDEPAPVSPWTPPQLEKLTIDGTAAASPTDFVDGGFLS
jgi:hypothetical protein